MTEKATNKNSGAPSMSTLVKDITNKLFDQTPTSSKKVTTVFNDRSKSVLVSPTGLSAYTPIKHA